MNVQPPILSPALARALVVFVIGLVILVVGAALALGWTLRRRRVDEDAVRRVFRNSAIPLVLQIGLRAIDMAFAAVLYRVLLPTEQGEYDLATLVVGLVLTTVVDWGLTVWLTREVARDPTATTRLFGTTLVVRWALSLAVFPLLALSWLLFNGLSGGQGAALTPLGIQLIALFAVTLLPTAVASAATAVFLAHEEPTTPMLANVLNNGLSTLLRIGVLVAGWGVLGVAWGAVAATVINAGVFAWLLWRRWGWPGLGWDAKLARTMLGAGFPLMLNALLVAVFFRFDTLIVRAAQGPVAVANYGAAYRWAQLALVLPPMVVNAVFPRFARQALDDRAGLRRGYRQTVRVLLLLALPLSALLTVFAPTVIGALSGQQYVAAGAPALAWLIWFVPWSYVNGVGQYVLIALNRQATITWAFAGTALFNLAANLVAVPRWGINAAAAITVLSEVVLCVPFVWMLRRELGNLQLWALAWRPALAALAMLAAMWPLRAWLVPAALLGMAVYSGALWLLRTFTIDDQRLLGRVLGRQAGTDKA